MFTAPTHRSDLLEDTTWWSALGVPRPTGMFQLNSLKESMLNWVYQLGWKDELPPPAIRGESGIRIVDDSTTGVGSKARFADLLFSLIEEDEVVYVQPRYGWAGISLCHLAEKHHKKLTLFMPASAKSSEHQRVAIERGADPRFVRVAAMPVLNGYAKQYAVSRGACFLPLGLKHPFVTAAAVSVIEDLFANKEPGVMWSVISTGVLSRALQIALIPRGWSMHAIAVARNLHDGELGRASFTSYDLPFARRARTLPETFDSAENYDAKGFETAVQLMHLGRNNWFWNVAGNVKPLALTAAEVHSDRAWGDVYDLTRP